MSTNVTSLKSEAPNTGVTPWAAAGLLTLVGLAAWFYQLSAGMEVTGLGQQVVWGAYIAAFFTAVGAGAGLLALVGLDEFTQVMHAGLRRKALALALSFFVAGGFLIMMDLGNPAKILAMVTAFRGSSMMTWDFWLLAIAAIVTLIVLWQRRGSRALGALAVTAAVLVVVIEGWMLSTLAAHPRWGGGLLVISFLIAAAIGGAALLALLQPTARLRTILSAGLACALIVLAAEVLGGMVSRDPRTADETSRLLTGSGAALFWSALLFLTAALILAVRGSLKAAGVVALVGIVLEKMVTLAVGQAESWVGFTAEGYLPTWIEAVAIIGMAGLAWLVYLTLKRSVLPKLPAAE